MINYNELYMDSAILDDNDFVQWWAEHKGTVQTKAYRPELTKRIDKSHFDALLESNGLKWGGNVDGFIVDPNSAWRRIYFWDIR